MNVSSITVAFFFPKLTHQISLYKTVIDYVFTLVSEQRKVAVINLIQGKKERLFRRRKAIVWEGYQMITWASSFRSVGIIAKAFSCVNVIVGAALVCQLENKSVRVVGEFNGGANIF